MASREVARRTRPIGELARAEFSQQQVNVIRATVARDASDAELAMFLEVCSRYELDPFVKQVHFLKTPGRDGGPGSNAIVVGRDGLLAIANRNSDYRGFLSDVVREKDEFRVVRASPDNKPEDAIEIGGGRFLIHVYEGHHRQRGEVVGAWCVALREGRQPKFFYAPLEDYRPENPNARTPWGRGMDSVMIEKVAIANAHRTQFEITGLYEESEIARVIEAPRSMGDEIEWGEDDYLAARLRQLFDAANQIRPDAFTDAKIKLLLADKTPGEREDVATQVERFISDNGGEVPDWPEPIEDAEVVDEVEEVEEDGAIAEPEDEPEEDEEPEAEEPLGQQRLVDEES